MHAWNRISSRKGSTPQASKTWNYALVFSSCSNNSSKNFWTNSIGYSSSSTAHIICYIHFYHVVPLGVKALRVSAPPPSSPVPSLKPRPPPSHPASLLQCGAWALEMLLGFDQISAHFGKKFKPSLRTKEFFSIFHKSWPMTAQAPRTSSAFVPGHITRAPPIGFELATNGIQSLHWLFSHH